MPFVAPLTSINRRLRQGFSATSVCHHRPIATMTEEVQHEPALSRYILVLPGIEQPAFLSYEIQDTPNGTVYDLQHTFVNPAMRGQGVAARLVKKAVEHAREENHKVKPTCSYIHTYMKRYKEDNDVLETHAAQESSGANL